MPSLDQLETLLDVSTYTDNNLNNVLNQKKQFNDIQEGTITEKDVTYSLQPTDMKRNIIFENGKFVGTSNKIISIEE